MKQCEYPYRVNLHIQSECWKIWTRKIPNTDAFHAGVILDYYRCPALLEHIKQTCFLDGWLWEERFQKVILQQRAKYLYD